MADQKKDRDVSADDRKAELVETELDLGGSSDSPFVEAEKKNRVVEQTVDLGDSSDAGDDEPTADATSVETAKPAKVRLGKDSSAAGDETATDVDESASDDVDGSTVVSAQKKRREGLGEIAADPQNADRIRLGIKLLIVAVVLAAIATLLALHPGAKTSENKAFVSQKATSELIGQATNRICSPFVYKYEQVEDFLKGAREDMVDTARANFDKYAETQRKIIVQAKADQDCKVDQIGVLDQTRDRAVVIATLIISSSANGVASDSGTPRAQFVFVKRDGQWLISDVGDV